MATGTIPLGNQTYKVDTGNAKFEAYRTGNVMQIFGSDLSESVSAGSYKNIWTVPLGMRPKFAGYGIGVNGTTRDICEAFYNSQNAGLYVASPTAMTVTAVSILFIME